MKLYQRGVYNMDVDVYFYRELNGSVEGRVFVTRFTLLNSTVEKGEEGLILQ